MFLVQISWAQLKIGTNGSVGIGIDNPGIANKLYVINESGQYGNYAIKARTKGGGGYNYGVYATAEAGTNVNYGLCAIAKYGLYTYGVYGRGYNGSRKNYAGYFSGDVRITGDYPNPSDIKLKENIKSIGTVSPNLMKLKAKTFNFKKDDPEYKHMHLASGKRYGFTAQDLEKIFPELVSTDAHPPEDENEEPVIYKSINYIEMITILVEAIQEQQQQIEELKKEMGK